MKNEIIPPSIVLHKGSSVHKAAEVNFKQKITTRQDLPQQQILDAAHDTLGDKIVVDGLNLSRDELSAGRDSVINKAHESVARMTRLYIDGIAPRYQPVDIESKTTIAIPNTQINLVGVRDLLDESGVLVDLKTTTKRKSQAEADTSPPLTAYALAHHVLSQQPTSQLRLEVMVDKNVPEVQTLLTQRNEDDYSSLVASLTEVVRGIEKEVFPPAYGQTGAWWCSAKFCGYHSTCPYIPAHKRGIE